MERMHQKREEGRRRHPRDIFVPNSRDTLLLFYGPKGTGEKSSLVGRRAEEMPGYKRDAMRLIANRLMKRVANAFNEIRDAVGEEGFQAKRQVGQAGFTERQE